MPTIDTQRLPAFNFSFSILNNSWKLFLSHNYFYWGMSQMRAKLVDWKSSSIRPQRPKSSIAQKSSRYFIKSTSCFKETEIDLFRLKGKKVASHEYCIIAMCTTQQELRSKCSWTVTDVQFVQVDSQDLFRLDCPGQSRWRALTVRMETCSFSRAGATGENCCCCSGSFIVRQHRARKHENVPGSQTVECD